MNNIQKYRMRARLSQGDLSKLIKANPKYINQIEWSQETPSKRFADRIIRELNKVYISERMTDRVTYDHLF